MEKKHKRRIKRHPLENFKLFSKEPLAKAVGENIKLVLFKFSNIFPGETVSLNLLAHTPPPPTVV